MSSPSVFHLRRFPSTIIISRKLGRHKVPKFSSASQGVLFLRQFASFSKDCGPSVKLSPLCYHRSSYVGTGTINLSRSRFSEDPSSILAGMYPKKKLYHTNPNATRARMLSRLDTWLSYRNFRRKQIQQYFDLRYVFRMLDVVYFRGLLQDRITLMWEPPKGNSDRLSRTTLELDAKRGPCFLIVVVRPLTNGPWTQAIIKDRFEVLLCEVTQIYLLLEPRNCVPFLQLNSRAAKAGQSRHSFSLKTLLRGVKREVDRIFQGFPRP